MSTRRLFNTLRLIFVAVVVWLAAVMLLGEEGGGAVEQPQVLGDVPVTANDLRGARAQNSPMLAADPTNPRFVVAAIRQDAPDFSCGLELSGDGGRGWVPAQPVPKLPKGAEKCYAPEVAFDRAGVLYYLFVGLRGIGNNPIGVFLTSSHDRGHSFSDPQLLLGPGNYQVRMALDPTMGKRGRIHLVWLQTTAPTPTGGLPPPPNPILTAYSDDGGQSFSRPIQISDPQRSLSVAPALALGPDHAVHVLYYDLQGDRVDYQGLEGPTWPGRWSLVATTSSDAGAHFARGVVVDDQLKPPGRVMLIYTMPPPALAADGAGRLFAAWYDARNGDWDVFLKRSTDNGRTWGRPIRLNDDRRGDGRNQYLPRLAVAPDGRVDAIFYDRRNDPQNIRNDVYYTFSRDGGQSFSPNIKLTSASSDTRSGQRYLVPSAKGLVEFGARLALISEPSHALAAWTDTRNAITPPYQDVFATEVALGPGGSPGQRSP